MTENQDFGPWATMFDTGPRARLSTFWKRRMAMLPSTAGAEKRVSRRVGFVVLLVAIAALSAPTFYLMRAPQAKAGKPPQPQAAPAPSGSPTNVATTNTSAPSGAAPAQRIEFMPQPSEQEEQILEALDEPIKLDLDDSSLADAMEYIEQKIGASIYLDERSV